MLCHISPFVKCQDLPDFIFCYIVSTLQLSFSHIYQFLHFIIWWEWYSGTILFYISYFVTFYLLSYIHYYQKTFFLTYDLLSHLIICHSSSIITSNLLYHFIFCYVSISWESWSSWSYWSSSLSWSFGMVWSCLQDNI